MPRLLSLITAFALVLTACGSSEDATSDTSAQSTDQASTTSTFEAEGDVTTTSTTTEPATGATFDDPVVGGEFAQVGDWNVRVIDVIPDGTELVMEENQYNDPPIDGNQFFMATLEAEYVGTESGTFWVDMIYKAVGPSSVAYESSEAYCGVIPDAIDDSGETFPSGVVTGNVCWSVSGEDATALVMLLDQTFSFDNDARTVYDLDPAMTPIQPNESASVDLSEVPAIDIGVFAQVGDWNVRVIDVIPDGTELVMEENQYNDPPIDGNQFFMATLEAEYVGTESGTFWVDMIYKAVGPSSVAYESSEAYCGVIPDAIDDSGETFPSGVVTGNVCWSVTADDATDLVMLLDPTFSFDDDARVVYRLASPE